MLRKPSRLATAHSSVERLRVLQVGYSMPPAAVPGVTSTKLYACYSKASAYDRPWRTATDVLAVRLLSNLPFACKVRR